MFKEQGRWRAWSRVSKERQESRSQGGVWVGEYRNEQMNTKNMGWEKEETLSKSVLLAF